MFVFSFKASKFRILFAVVLCALIAFAAVVLLPETEHTVTVNGVQSDRKIRFDGMKTTADLAAFAENLGYAVDATPAESVNVKLPHKFDAVLEKYNEIQKSQGFNLAKYKNKEVMRHTFRVTALPNEEPLPKEEVLLTFILHKDKIIGGDLFYTGEQNGVYPFLK